MNVEVSFTTTRTVTVDGIRPKASPVGKRAPGAMEVFIDSDIARGVVAHVGSTRDVEVGGILAGHIEEDGGEFVRVTAALEAKHTVQTLGSLTFTHDTWADFADTMVSRHPSEKIVGWYHSHPGHGVFMSKFDLFLHRSFFPNLWQVAWVIDPVRSRQGLFQWAGGEIVRSGYGLVGAVAAEAPVDAEVSLEPVADQPALQVTRLETILREFDEIVDKSELRILLGVQALGESIAQKARYYAERQGGGPG